MPGVFLLAAQAGMPVLLKSLAEKAHDEKFVVAATKAMVGFGLGLVPALGFGGLGASGMDGLTWLGVC